MLCSQLWSYLGSLDNQFWGLLICYHCARRVVFISHHISELYLSSDPMQCAVEL